MASTRRPKPVEQWRDRRQVLGIRGEQLATEFLLACGWTVEAQRFRLGRHDIDVVVRKGRLVAFVEVKTRRSDICGAPVQSVGRLKQRRIGRVAAYWALRHGRPDDDYRFDVVAVDGAGQRPAVEHIPDAWRLESPWIFR